MPPEKEINSLWKKTLITNFQGDCQPGNTALLLKNLTEGNIYSQLNATYVRTQLEQTLRNNTAYDRCYSIAHDKPKFVAIYQKGNRFSLREIQQEKPKSFNLFTRMKKTETEINSEEVKIGEGHIAKLTYEKEQIILLENINGTNRGHDSLIKTLMINDIIPISSKGNILFPL